MQRLFVYGSLRSGMRHPVFAFITRYFTLQGEAKVKGKLYDLGEYPGALPVQEETYIKGEMYEAKSNEAFNYAIEQMDDYEGVHAGKDKTPLFRREEVVVFINNKTAIAWIYWYNRSVEGTVRIESGDYLQYKSEKHKRV